LNVSCDELLYEYRQVAFESLVVESIGGWNLEGKKLLKKIAARVAMERFMEGKTLLRDMMPSEVIISSHTSFSICLNAQMMLYNGSVSFDPI
jgi:hypothetical protein